MYRIVSITVLSVILLFSSGCAKYWYQEEKSFKECIYARAECFEELKKRTDFSGQTADYEIDFMNMCMQSKGYSEVSSDKLPLDVKRLEPNTSLNWRARGVAGTIEP